MTITGPRITENKFLPPELDNNRWHIGLGNRNLLKGSQETSQRRKAQNWAQQLLIAGTLTVLICGTTRAAFAQSDSERIGELERKLERSQQIIEEMAARIQKLETLGDQQEASRPTGPATPPVAVTNLPAKETGHAHDAQPAPADSGIITVFGTPLHGFGDVGGLVTNAKNRRKGFTVGSLDFYLTPDFGANVRGLAELNFEVNSEGDLDVDLERFQLGYGFGDYATAWLGRFHTPFGYFNTAFHHGTQLQTAVRRPQFLDFEDKGGILPVHTVGLWGTGGVALGDGKLTYDLYVGNAASIEDGTLNMNMAGLSRFRPSFGTSVGYTFRGALEGLKTGLHWLRGDVQSLTLNDKTALNITGGYLVYPEEPWELITELYRFDNKDLSGKTGTHGSWATFGQLARTFGRWTPYGRAEWTSLNQRDPYFRDLETGRSYVRGALGIRYDLTNKAALKLELRRTRTKQASGDSQSDNAGELQFSVRF
jgi:hypothetical protein